MIEGNGSAVRQLEPFETLFLMQFHMRFTKPAKLIDFVINSAEVAAWKQMNASLAIVSTPGTNSSSFKTKVGSKAMDGRNSITVGSIHHDIDGEESKDISEPSRYKHDLTSG